MSRELQKIQIQVFMKKQSHQIQLSRGNQEDWKHKVNQTRLKLIKHKSGKWTGSSIELFCTARELKTLYITYLIHPFTPIHTNICCVHHILHSQCNRCIGEQLEYQYFVQGCLDMNLDDKMITLLDKN